MLSIPADPGAPDSSERLVPQAGQVRHCRHTSCRPCEVGGRRLCVGGLGAARWLPCCRRSDARTGAASRAHLCGVLGRGTTRCGQPHTAALPARCLSTAHTRLQSAALCVQVWFPDSAQKTAHAMEEFDREGLPLVILANWRGFSGGQRDLFEGVLQARPAREAALRGPQMMHGTCVCPSQWSLTGQACTRSGRLVRLLWRPAQLTCSRASCRRVLQSAPMQLHGSCNVTAVQDALLTARQPASLPAVHPPGLKLCSYMWLLPAMQGRACGWRPLCMPPKSSPGDTRQAGSSAVML